MVRSHWWQPYTTDAATPGRGGWQKQLWVCLLLLSTLIPATVESSAATEAWVRHLLCHAVTSLPWAKGTHRQLIKDQVYNTPASISGWHIHFKLVTPFNQRPSCLNIPRKVAKFNTASQHLYKEITYSRVCYSGCSAGGEMQGYAQFL